MSEDSDFPRQAIRNCKADQQQSLVKAALEMAVFHDAYMARKFPRGPQIEMDAGTLDPHEAETWGRCKTIIAKAN